MSSTNARSEESPSSAADWRAAGLRYFPYGFFLRQRFGHRVQKVSIDAGFSCPNMDGRLASDGCIFCDNRSFSPSRRLSPRAIGEQIHDAIRRLRVRYACDHYIAYFQPSTNTYGPVGVLQAVYEQALAHPQIVGLAIGTRPDCVPDEVLTLLGALAKRTYLSVEYGIQTSHNRSLDWLRRGHTHSASQDAIQRSRGRGFAIGAHVILGLPGETREDMLSTARELATLQLDSVKIHNLYAVANTKLADCVTRGEVALLPREEYVSILADFLECLPPTTIVERLGGDAPPEFLVGPAWCLDKAALRNAVIRELERRDTWQGRLWHPSCAAPVGQSAEHRLG